MLKIRSKSIICTFWIFILAFIKCETVVDFNITYPPPSITFRGTISSQDGFFSSVNLSVSPLDTIDFEQEIDATINIYKDDIFLLEALHAFEEHYYADSSLLLAQPGDLFRIEANISGYGNVSASTIIPSQIEVSGFNIVDTIQFDGVDHYNLQFTIHDEENLGNKYAINIFYIDSAGFRSAICMQANDLIFNEIYSEQFDIENEPFIFCSTVYFNDKSFNNQDKEINLYFPIDTYEQLGAQFLVVQVMHISEELYLFETTSVLQANTIDNPFAQPVTIYQNVSGDGYGILGSCTEAYHLFYL